MTANQRRPGFRLPWSSETDDEAGAESDSGAPASEGPEQPTSSAPPAAAATPAPPTPAAAPSPATPADAAAAVKAPAPAVAPAEPPKAEPVPAATTDADPTDADPDAATAGADGGDEFMRDLVYAMRRVAEEARDAGLSDLRTRADEQVSQLEADADRRREDLRARADTDVDAVGEWAKTEAERIKQEAEQRVVARRTRLEQQLAGETQRTETETKALRDRVAQYERELEAYHGQLGEINDPAAFAAAAKRMPKAPELVVAAAVANPTAADPTPTAADPTPTATDPTPAAAEPAAAGPAPAKEPGAAATPPTADEALVEPVVPGSNGVPTPTDPIHPAEEEVLTARLAQLDATLPADNAGAAAAPAAGEAVVTEVVVKGLGSFGAITGFRQALSGIEGIDAVALSLGQTGEFVFRATHAGGFDVRNAIGHLEGDAAKIEDRPEGGLRVTLDRAR